MTTPLCFSSLSLSRRLLLSLTVVCHHYENRAIILYDFSELVSLVGLSYDYTLKFQTTQR